MDSLTFQTVGNLNVKLEGKVEPVKLEKLSSNSKMQGIAKKQENICILCGFNGPVEIKVSNDKLIMEYLYSFKSRKCGLIYYCKTCCYFINQINASKEKLQSSNQELETIVTGVESLLGARKRLTIEPGLHGKSRDWVNGDEMFNKNNPDVDNCAGSTSHILKGTLIKKEIEENEVSDSSRIDDLIDIKEEPCINLKLWEKPKLSARKDAISYFNKSWKKRPAWAKTCYFCQKQFASKANLQKHISSHTNEKQSEKCEICKAILSSKCNLKIHILAMHGSTEAREKFREAARIRAQKGGPRFCYFCSMKLSSYHTLERHVKLKHTNELFPLECNKCGKVYPKKQSLVVHQKLVCMPDQEFIQKSQENSQKWLNNFRLSVDCYFCQTHFARRDTFETHMLRHTEEKPPGVLKCEECLKIFAKNGSLGRHKKRYCKGRRSDLPTKQEKAAMYWRNQKVDVKCYFCKRNYVHKNSLKRHMSSHTMEISEFCKRCRRVFFNSNDFREHRRTPCQLTSLAGRN